MRKIRTIIGLVITLGGVLAASIYDYDSSKHGNPSLSLVEAADIAKKISAKFKVRKFVIHEVLLLGVKKQDGGGMWQFRGRTSSFGEVSVIIYFPQDRCVIYRPGAAPDGVVDKVLAVCSRQGVELQEELEQMNRVKKDPFDKK